VTETDFAETEGEVHKGTAEQGVPEIVLEDVDTVGEWHTG
jgi:hypothetical protein